MSKNIGLIDDSRVMRSILRKSIQMCHYKVELFMEAENGLEGYKMLAENQENLDIAFLDLHMPEMGGLEMLKKLREGGFSAVPIIVVSTSADSKTQQECAELGAVGFIHKPFTPQELGAQMSKVVGDA